jgi:hypothetical protein
MLRQDVSVLHTIGPQFQKHLIDIDVIPIGLAGGVAGPAKLAMIDNVGHGVVQLAPFLEHGIGHNHLPGTGVGVEVVLRDGGTVPGKPPALHLVIGNPLAGGAPGATFHIVL